MTLYDLLGALPNDDAEGLRTAFRRAVKGAHPDIHPGDPDAACKFRRIVRAHDILGDAEQRAAYDHLLDLAHLEEASASGQAVAARIRRLASGVIALAGVSVMTVGGYLLLIHMSAAAVAPPGKVDVTMRTSTEIAAVSPAASTDTTGRSASLAQDEKASVPGRAIATSAALPKRGASASRNLNGPIADLNPATRLDPKFSPATTDRGVTIYRSQKFERAFADIAATRQIERPDRSTSASTTAGAPRFGPTGITRSVTPAPRRRTLAQDPSREEGIAQVRLR